MDELPGYLKHADSGRAGKGSGFLPQKVVIDDTLSVCSRNSIADVTFYDSLNFIKDLKFIPAGRIGYRENTEIADSSQQMGQMVLVNDLKNGDPFPEKPFHNDFITIALFLSAFLLLSVRSALRKTLQEITRFFLFRGINESSSRDMSSLFNWQSTVINFISFLILSLFAFNAFTYFGIRSPGTSPSLFMLILFGIVVFGITSRHFLCKAAGNLSGEGDVFNEYLIAIYQSYRFSSIFLFTIVVLITYTVFIPQKIWLITGFLVLIVFYVFRVSRLFLIFLKRGISILYLILYLCALEILPVLILLKYFSGLV
jgi:hypothetical protein